MRKVIGVNPVKELLNSGKYIENMEVYEGADSAKKKGGNLAEVIHLAEKRGIKIAYVKNKDENSQGIAAFTIEKEIMGQAEMLEKLALKNRAVVLVLDELQDPRNLGAIIRSADAFGADGIVIPENRSVQVNETVIKTSAGAVEYVDIAVVTNLNNFLIELKKIGFWVYGAEADGDKLYYEEKYPDKTCLVLGSEGKGVRQKVKEKCDITISIPMFGNVNSLNVSVAGGILLSEISKNRRG